MATKTNQGPPSKAGDILQRFKVKDEPTKYVYLDYLRTLGNLPESKALIEDYHPGVGGGYEVTTDINNTGASPYLYLTCSGNAWSDTQRAFNEKLRYVALPDIDLPNNRPNVLLLSQHCEGMTIGNSSWQLVYSRMEKYLAQPVVFKHAGLVEPTAAMEINDVILMWKHPDWDEYVISCWKW